MDSVWLAWGGEYEQAHVAAVARTYEEAVEAVKASYGPPYKVEWSMTDEGLRGDFQAVLHYSTAHTAYFYFEERDIWERDCNECGQALPHHWSPMCGVLIQARAART